MRKKLSQCSAKMMNTSYFLNYRNMSHPMKDPFCVLLCFYSATVFGYPRDVILFNVYFFGIFS